MQFSSVENCDEQWHKTVDKYLDSNDVKSVLSSSPLLHMTVCFAFRFCPHGLCGHITRFIDS